MLQAMKAPFPWFGGKSRAAAEVWARFGNVPNYVEPFFGSGAVLLGRPYVPGIETVNDKDGFVCNFWRALRAGVEGVAEYADWPVNENDLHARHAWLKPQRDTLSARLEGDPDYFDVKIAGWWVWGISCWIGAGFCTNSGPWHIVDGQLVLGDAGNGVARKRAHLGNAGKGVARKLVHLGNAGKGVARKLVQLGNAGNGITRQSALAEYLNTLSSRLRFVRVCCGGWERILGPAPTEKNGITGIFLDPPYGKDADRDMGIYSEDSGTVAGDVRTWAIAHGNNPMLRIALCGYESEHEMPPEWDCYHWSAQGGYSSIGNGAGKDNRHRERIWFSPACLQTRLF